ncbi:hypothetical protein GGR50DRAFT_673000 [Xylaria sp. CBS 124048]|nr:hypothetical protein GGR50DRAFT_673000 [Xylaria sp. CBS 124048]
MVLDFSYPFTLPCLALHFPYLALSDLPHNNHERWRLDVHIGKKETKGRERERQRQREREKERKKVFTMDGWWRCFCSCFCSFS